MKSEEKNHEEGGREGVGAGGIGGLGSPVLPIREVVVEGERGAGRLACTAAFIFLAKSRKVHASINL